MSKDKQYTQEDGSYIVKKTGKKVSVLAFIVCALIALTIWVYVAGRDMKRDNQIEGDTDNSSYQSENTQSEE